MMQTKETGREETTRRKAAFTLAELLVVIAIIGAMLAVGLIGVRGIGQGSNMRAAISELRATVSLARQWAISRRVRTYVVFPDEFACVGDQMYKAYRAYAVFAVTNRSTRPYQGEYVSEWVFLPPGIVLDADETRGQSVFKPDIGVFTNIPFPTAASSAPADGIAALGFEPDGSSVEAANGYKTGFEVYLQEGWATVVTSPAWAVQYSIITGGMNRGVEVVGLTGGIKVHDYQLGY